MDFSCPSFCAAVGPKPRSHATLRALASHRGDCFFEPLPSRAPSAAAAAAPAAAEPYAAWLARRPEWGERPHECFVVATRGVAPAAVAAACAFVSACVPGLAACAPLQVRALQNGMRFVPEKSVGGSCGEGGCRGQRTALSAHDILPMVERTAEAARGAAVLCLTPKPIFTEAVGVCEFSRSDRSRCAVVSTSVCGCAEPRGLARLLVRSVAELVGFRQCGWYKCLFNVMRSSAPSLSLCGDDPRSQLMVACPACLRRIGGLGNGVVRGGAGRSVGGGGGGGGGFGGRGGTMVGGAECDFAARYERVARWFAQHDPSAPELGWLRERYYSLCGRDLNVADGIAGAEGGAEEGVRGDPVAVLAAPVHATATSAASAWAAKDEEEEVSREEIRSKLTLLKLKRRRRAKK